MESCGVADTDQSDIKPINTCQLTFNWGPVKLRTADFHCTTLKQRKLLKGPGIFPLYGYIVNRALPVLMSPTVIFLLFFQSVCESWIKA